MSFEIVSDNVTVEDFTFISDSLSEIISIVSSNDVSIRSSEFTVQGVDDGNNAVIHIFDSDNVTIDLNIINFIVETNDTYENRAIFAEGSNDLIIVNSDICAYLPSRSIDWATGTVYSEGVFLDDCNNAILDDNTIAVMSNDKIGDYDSIYAVHVIGDNASIVYSRIAAAEAPYGYALVITGENFKIDDNYLAAGENSTYACGIDVESNSNGNITDNEIVVIGESAYGIYTANWAGDVKANITNNIINATGNTVFGMSLSGSEALVEANSILTQGNYTTGVASAVDNIAINDNEIIANGSNVGTPAGYDTMGIETIGVNIVSGNATVTNNKINATNKYAVDFDGEGQVTDNEIYADVLTGDFAVDYSQEDNVLVENNTPEMELDYKLTNDTFYIYFDEEGVIREQIDADNLTFIGEFSNLVDVIIINKPIHVLGDNATLNNISMAIVAENVVVDGFNFTGERSGLIILYSGNVQVKNNNFNINGSNNDSNAVIGILDSENVTLENNTIIFGVETNDTFLNTAVDVKDSDNLIMTGNTITALLPARSVNWTTGDVYSQGVFLNGCNNAVLENNTVGVKSNDQIGEYDTIYAVNINGDNATVIGNILGAVEAPYGYALVIAGENFNITNNMIVAGENGTYACGIDVESNSNGVIDSNLIYAVANESAYGIYTANWAGDVKANITNNIILSNASSPFGLSLSGSEALVENNSILVQGNYTTGIASAVDNIVINNNTIIANASNEGTPAGYDTMGIETTGIHIVSGSAKVTDNDVTTTGEFTVDLDGTGQVTDNQLVADVYTGDASVDYTPDQRTIVQNNTPAMQRAVISAEDVVMYYKNGTRYVIVLTDQEGIPLANKSVTLTINGASYNRTTDENGTASLAINLNSGNYTASALFVGESGYSNATAEINITVLSTVFGDDIVKMFKNGTQYYATFLDGQGNPLADGTEVTFNINGVMYKRYVNGSEGKAKLNINLVPGVYVITAINPVNGEMHANNITVLATIEGNDLVKYYKNESQYVVTVYGADGKAVGAGETVTFNINGVFYTRQTNASGQAKLNINLQPGNYTITADYNGAKISNNIEVKPVLSAKDLVKKYGTSDQFIAYLVDGQGKAYSGQTINFNINGVFYKRVTDSDGRGTLNIKLGAAKDVYIITSSYNGSSISNTITIVD
jgi:Zn/Cd-binding protein ZinT